MVLSTLLCRPVRGAGRRSPFQVTGTRPQRAVELRAPMADCGIQCSCCAVISLCRCFSLFECHSFHALTFRLCALQKKNHARRSSCYIRRTLSSHSARWRRRGKSRLRTQATKQAVSQIDVEENKRGRVRSKTSKQTR